MHGPWLALASHSAATAGDGGDGHGLAVGRNGLVLLAAVALLLAGLPLISHSVEAATPPAFRSVGTGSANNDFFIDIATPPGVVAGDIMLAQVTARLKNVVVTPPAGWFLIRNDRNNGQEISQHLYWRAASGSEPATYRWNVDNPTRMSGAVSAYSGVDITYPIDAHSGQTKSNQTAIEAPSVTTRTSDTLLVGFFGAGYATTIAAPGTMTQRWEVGSGGGGPSNQSTSEGATEVLGAAGPTGVRTATAADVASNVGQLVALAPAGFGSPMGTVGRVFEDISGNALGSGETPGDANNPGVAGATVHVYQDAGVLGTPEVGSDLAVAGSPFTTDGSGLFNLGLLADGQYWVVVDAQSLGPNTRWAEQTYGPIGGWCADGSGGTTTGTASSGACYGGRRGDQSDVLTSWDTTAEHLALVTVSGGSGPANLDFGFSFNVVTTTRGGDATVDPGASGTQTVQGSLRQFITNANDIGGANVMRFVPAGAPNDGSGLWWRITVSNVLPTMTDAGTIVDGTAYQLSDGLTVRDQNPGFTGANAAGGMTVGAGAGVALPQVSKPELELQGSGVVNGFELLANDLQVRRLAIHDFTSYPVRVGPSGGADYTGIRISGNVIGSGAGAFTGSLPASSAVGVYVEDADGARVEDNLIGWFDTRTVDVLDSVNVVVHGNELRSTNEDIVDVYLTTDGVTVEENLIYDGDNWGIESFGTNSIVRNNTVQTVGDGAGQTGGVRFFSAGHTAELNVIEANAGPGIAVAGTKTSAEARPRAEVLITRNEFGTNAGLAIDLQAASDDNDLSGDGITLNDGATNANSGNLAIDFPVIDGAQINGGNLTVTGFARPGAVIEFYEAVGAADDENAGGAAHGEGVTWLFSATEGVADADPTTGASYADPNYGSDPNVNRFSFTVAAPAGLNHNDEISATGSDGSNTSEFGPNFIVTSNNPPSFDQDLGDRVDGTGATVSIDSGATDPDVGDTLFYSATGLPPGITINSSSGLISGTLPEGSEGTYAVTITVVDDGTPILSDVDTFTWTVTLGFGLISDIFPTANDLLTWMNSDDFAPATNEIDIGTGTGTTTMKGMDIQPGTGVVYAAAGASMGTIDGATGLWSALGAMGSGDGAAGTVTMDDVTALSFDPISGVLWAVHRRSVAGEEDLLFQVDPTTGALVPDVFPGLDDYILIANQATRADVEAIAVDPSTGVMYGVIREGTNTRLVTIDKSTGATASQGGLDPIQIYGLTFDATGQLWGVGYDKVSPGIENLYEIDKTNASTANPRVIDNGVTYQAVATPLAFVPGIYGVAFEDIAGNLLAGGEAIGDAANPPAPGVDVYLYLDDGVLPIAPGPGDTPIGGTQVTDGAGAFGFQGLADGTYWVVVDSRTVPSSTGLNAGFAQTDIWAEQTYGPDGSWCADGLGGTTEGVASGACYGGRRGAQSDGLITWYDDAEHIARVDVAGEPVTAVAYGFSFNAVTNVDTSTAAATTGRTAQGSLDQFIRNADAIVGGNAMRFIPAVPPNDGSSLWWQLDYGAAVDPLRVINDTGTVIDGTAFSRSDGVTVRDQNPGFLGANAGGGLTVGTEDVALPQVKKPELEIKDASLGVEIAGSLVPDGTGVYDLSIWGAANSIDVSTGTMDGIRIERNVVGSPPGAFADPGGIGDYGIQVNATASIPANGGVIADNLVGFLDYAGIHAETSGAGWTITGNEVTGTGQVGTTYDAIMLWNGQHTITGNYVHTNNSIGLDTSYDGGNYIENNTFTNNGQAGVQTAGIRLQADGSTMRRNIITANQGPGIIVAEWVPDSANANLITENSFSANGGLGIDLIIAGGDANLGDGVNVNDGLTDPTTGNIGLDHPVLAGAGLVAGTLTISGTVPAGTPIEAYVVAPDPTGYGEGVDYLTTPWPLLEGGPNDTDPAAGSFEFAFAAPIVAGTDEVTAIAIDGTGNTSEFGPNFAVNEPPSVTNPGGQVNAEGDIVSLFITASDPDGNILAYTATDLPPGLWMNQVTGEIQGTLSYTSSGVYLVTVTVSDDGGPPLSDSTVFTWTVNDVPLPDVPLDITKTSDGGGFVNAGDTIKYTIIAVNTDIVKQTNFTITDALPAGTTYVPGSTQVTAPVSSFLHHLDAFNAQAYNGSDGTEPWATDWQEIGEADGPLLGAWQVNQDGAFPAYALYKTNQKNMGLQRVVDLSGYAEANLSFNYRRDGMTPANDLHLQVSPTGVGGPWTSLFVISGGPGGVTDPAYRASPVIDLSPFMTATTAVRFFHVRRQRLRGWPGRVHRRCRPYRGGADQQHLRR